MGWADAPNPRYNVLEMLDTRPICSIDEFLGGCSSDDPCFLHACNQWQCLCGGESEEGDYL